MATAIVTGSAGLRGSETARALFAHDVAVAGIDNGMWRRSFADEASTAEVRRELEALSGYRHDELDIRGASERA